MPISKLKIKWCKLVPTVTILCTRACKTILNVRKSVHANIKFIEPCSIRHYCLFLKDMGWKYTAYHITHSDPGHTCSKQQLDKTLKITFTSLSRKSDEKEKKKKKLEWQLQSFLHFTQMQKHQSWKRGWINLPLASKCHFLEEIMFYKVYYLG